MPTTNPPAGPNNPGGDAPKPVTGPAPGAGRQWPADAAHGSAPDDHGGGGGVNPAALRAGHEPDVFAVKPILSIPAAVVVAFVIAFLVAAGVFAYVMNESRKPDPNAHPDAVAAGSAPLNDRLLRTDRKGQGDNKLRQVDQPRLEPLKRLEANGQFFARPELPTGNSPQIHPEDIYPDRFPLLQRAGYVGGNKTLARIPIADAMKVAAGDKGMFPVQAGAARPATVGDWPNAANAGRGFVPPAPKNDAAPKKDQPKKDEKTPATPEKK